MELLFTCLSYNKYDHPLSRCANMERFDEFRDLIALFDVIHIICSCNNATITNQGVVGCVKKRGWGRGEKGEGCWWLFNRAQKFFMINGIILYN